MEYTNETPLADLKKSALEHYNQASTAVGHWDSLIPQAINAYQGQRRYFCIVRYLGDGPNPMYYVGEKVRSYVFADAAKYDSRETAERVLTFLPEVFEWRVEEHAYDDGEGTIPRRCDLVRNTPAELAIRSAVSKVEEMGADPRLTDAVIKLDEAFELIADYTDGS